MQNEQLRERGRKGRGDTNSRVEGKDRGRFGQRMGVRRNGGQERMHGVDKMNTEGNSKEGKLEIWKEEE